MYENKTYESLLQEKLSKLPNTLDKREGSIIFDSLAPNALESAMIYAALRSILDETFADTASRDYLIRRCMERGIKPYPATYAVAEGWFNIDVPVGSRFSCDRFNWIVTEKIEPHKYYLTCETSGSLPNGYTGRLIPIEYIAGLTEANLTQVVVPGEDEEDTETLRQRYFASFDNQSYGFNRAQYIEATEAIPGVGGCKVYRAFSGPGTVKLVITDSQYSTPSKTLIDRVQTIIDPTQNSGEGVGLAPIDHEVTVEGAVGTSINISTSLSFAPGWTIKKCLPYIENTLDTYYKELNATWRNEDNLIVRVSQIESRILSLPGIADITHTKLNGKEGNVVLEENSIALRGEFVNE